MYLWVNGKYVGYRKIDKLEAEFDLTSYLNRAEEYNCFSGIPLVRRQLFKDQIQFLYRCCPRLLSL